MISHFTYIAHGSSWNHTYATISAPILWWPKVDSDKNAFVQRCATFQIYAPKRSKFNLSSWEDSRSFLERVHIDIAHWQGHRFVVFVDSFSKWVDIQYLKDLSAASLANILRRIFKYVGLPTTLVSGNGTNFTSKEFLKYLSDSYVHHVFTPPGHHASNGQVKRVIQEFKIHLNKTQCSSLMLEIERAIINFCLHRNTTPSANGLCQVLLFSLKVSECNFLHNVLNLFCQLSFQCLFAQKIDDLFQKQFQSTDATRMSVVMVVWFMMLTLLLALSAMMATHQYRRSRI